jgi:hypothetical protein
VKPPSMNVGLPKQKVTERELTALLAQAAKAPSGDDLLAEFVNLAKTILDKNIAYGDSALNPVRMFSRADTVEQIKVRLDDKLSRLSRGELAGEDVELDIIGYLVLLRVARGRKKT